MNKKSAVGIGILVFFFVVGWLTHVFVFTPFILERFVQERALQEQNSQEQKQPEQKQNSQASEFMPPRPYLGDLGKLSLASSSCPDHLQQTRGNVLAFRTYEDASLTNPHVFPSYVEYLEYANSMSTLYNCPILTVANDSFEHDGSNGGNNTVIVPTYASDDSPFLQRARESSGLFLARPKGIDPVGHYDWEYTADDEKNRARKEDQPISDVPGDPNWGGPEYTEYVLSTGKHAGSTVVMNRPVFKYTPKM